MADLHHEPMTNWTKVSLSGKITYEVTQAMKIQAETILTEMGERPILVCDLGRVTFLDSSGIGFLVFLNNKVRQRDGCFYLYQPNEVVVKTLELVQLLAFFELIENESELITRLPM
ncbi:STAS domain-containing protein [Desulfonatronum lacustre]|uniref:STAS domain-containing protein n=1 Tax=Desulfonatronum lacustre TaxID=66849 RepID=UPI0004B5F7D9|nr:STAS domain-containing protein [Desulfonatronum lacustre]SMP49413.1 anti-sigma B factor antagonist [Desulfonatronum zhilinae]